MPAQPPDAERRYSGRILARGGLLHVRDALSRRAARVRFDRDPPGTRLTGAMASPRILVTGSCGLIGSDVCRSTSAAPGLRRSPASTSNHRAVFFGPEGDTSWALERLRARKSRPIGTRPLDIRDRARSARAWPKSFAPA